MRGRGGGGVMEKRGAKEMSQGDGVGSGVRGRKRKGGAEMR